MKMSESINEIASSMSKLQSETKGADKGSTNPFFKSKYSTLEDAWDSIRNLVGKYGLSIWQDVTTKDMSVSVSTLVAHTSGQWIEFGPFELPCIKKDPQSIGSSCSYAKRYALCAAMGIVSSSEDDDGEKAMEAHRPPKPKEFTVFDFIGHLYKTVDGDLSKDFNADLIENYLAHLAKEKKSSPGKIMDQAMNPQNTRRFIDSFEDWVAKEKG
jgi:hypothetical protein